MSLQLKIENTDKIISFEYDDLLSKIVSEIKSEIKTLGFILFLGSNGRLISILDLKKDYKNVRMNSSQKYHHKGISISDVAYNNVKTVLFSQEYNKILTKITENHTEMLYNHILYLKTKDSLYKNRINDFKIAVRNNIQKLWFNKEGGDISLFLNIPKPIEKTHHKKHAHDISKIIITKNPFRTKKIEIQSHDPFATTESIKSLKNKKYHHEKKIITL